MADGKVIIDTELDSSKAEKSAKKLGGTLKSGLSSAVGVAVKGIATVGATATVTSGAMVKLAKDTADAGDHIDKMSQKMGISAEAYQKWDYVAQISGTSIDGLKMGFKTLTTQMSSAQDGAEKSVGYFKELNISVDDLKNLSKEEIFEKTIKGLQNVTDETKRASLANKLLGRAGVELGPLLNSTNEDIDNLMKSAEEYGMIMSDDAVKASADFTDAMTTMTMSLTGFRNRLVAGVMPELTELFNGLSLIFKGDTQAGFEKVSEVISNIVSRVKNSVFSLFTEIPNKLKTLLNKINISITDIPSMVQGAMNRIKEMFGSFSFGDVGGIGTSFLTSILEEVTNNAPVIFETLGGLITTLLETLNEFLPMVYDWIIEIVPKIFGTLLGLLPSLIDQIPPILAQLFEIITASIAPSIELLKGLLKEALQKLPDVISSLVDNIPTIIGNLLDAIIDHGPDVAKAGLELFGELFTNLPDILGTLAKGIIGLVKGLVEALLDRIPDIAQAGYDFFTGLIENGPDILETLKQYALDVVSNILGVLGALIGGLADIAIKMVEGFGTAISTAWEIVSTTVSDWVSDVVDDIVGFFDSVWEGIKGIGSKLVGTIYSAIVRAWETVKTSVSDWVTGVVDGIVGFFDDLAGNISDIGKNIVEGIWDGISGAGGWLMDKISGFADGVVDGITGFFGISSPSKVMRDEVGKYLAEGIWVGFDENNPMDQINKDLEYGMKGIENSMTVSGGYYAGINYEKLGEAVAQGFIDADVEWTVDNRQFARLERGYA